MCYVNGTAVILCWTSMCRCSTSTTAGEWKTTLHSDVNGSIPLL